MGILDALFGRSDDQQNDQNTPNRVDAPPAQPRLQNADEQALARYRYMLQTAPPEELEQAHAEAFAKLTPQQRQLALQQMSQIIPESESRGLSDDPRALAQAATRAEMRQPGAMERMFGGSNAVGGGMAGGGVMGGLGGMMAGSLLTSLAGSFIGSSIAHSFFSQPSNEGAFQSSPEAQAVDGGASDYNSTDFEPTGLDSSADPYGDPGDVQDTGLDSSVDPYGDPDDTSFDSGGFDSGGADLGGADLGGADLGGDF